MGRGPALELIDRYRNICEYFEKAMAIFAGSFPYYNRTISLIRMGEKDRVFEALNKAVHHGGYNVKKDMNQMPVLIPSNRIAAGVFARKLKRYREKQLGN